jgi:chaperonin cofactor prefoldin
MTIKELEQRKEDISARLTALGEELKPLLKRVEQLRERIGHLELDRSTVLDQLREAKKSQ